MSADYDHVLVTARCASCSRPVSASFVTLRETGVFACVCGAATRARHQRPADAALFGGAGWQDAPARDHRPDFR